MTAATYRSWTCSEFTTVQSWPNASIRAGTRADLCQLGMARKQKAAFACRNVAEFWRERP